MMGYYHDGTLERIEQVIAAYPATINAPWKRRYTDDQLRLLLSCRCEHGNPTTTICDCGSGDLDIIWCEDCA